MGEGGGAGGGGCGRVLEVSSMVGAKWELGSSTVGLLLQNAQKGTPRVKGNSFPASEGDSVRIQDEVYCGKSPGSTGHSLRF